MQTQTASIICISRKKWGMLVPISHQTLQLITLALCISKTIRKIYSKSILSDLVMLRITITWWEMMIFSKSSRIAIKMRLSLTTLASMPCRTKGNRGKRSFLMIQTVITRTMVCSMILTKMSQIKNMETASSDHQVKVAQISSKRCSTKTSNNLSQI